MRFQSYFNHSLAIIDGYDGRTPLSHHLKHYFAGHKKHGSTDRKWIAHGCYSYYRLGHALKDQPTAERLKAALFLCTDDPAKWNLVFDREGWRMDESGELIVRLARVREAFPSFAVEDIFPWKYELSEGIDHYSFCLSFLRQPDLFLRIRPGYEKEVLQKLAGHTFIPPFTLRLPNGFKVEELFTPDKEIVVQDYSSQRLAPFLHMPDRPSSSLPPDPRPDHSGASPASLSVWDACAASGGKSLLAYDLNPNLELTVSDIRESILHNLDRRFRTAGIKNYHSFVADLGLPGQSPVPHPRPIHAAHAAAGRSALRQLTGSFDLIIADVPCSGSGTWSRTPEALYFFDPDTLDQYQAAQKKIVSRLAPRLAKNACLVYSTCSVFKKENEDMAAHIREFPGLRSDRVELIKGYEERADSMFAARFIC
jgi:16S rRNA (cytosine967-C5)-methyltransferase